MSTTNILDDGALFRFISHYLNSGFSEGHNDFSDCQVLKHGEKIALGRNCIIQKNKK